MKSSTWSLLPLRIPVWKSYPLSLGLKSRDVQSTLGRDLCYMPWLFLPFGPLLLLTLFLFKPLFAQQQRPFANDADLSACNPIVADTTWSTGVYTAFNCNIVVPAGVTLTIEGGVVVKVGGVSPNYGSGPNSAALIINGGLIVAGDSAQPVIFTSFTDDSRVGDSNANGTSSTAAGDWYGIVFRPGSHGRMENFRVGYAGSGTFNAVLGEYGQAQVEIREATVEMRSGEITDGLRTGIALRGAGITPVLENLALRNNQASDGRGYAIHQETINQNPIYRNLTLSGNDVDRVVVAVSDAINRNLDWGGAAYGFECGFTLCLITVPNGKTLTVAPGTDLYFGTSYGIAVADGGALIAQGTGSQPITFTNQTGTANAGQVWMGLWAQTGSKVRLDHCDISYADDSNYGLGALEINSSDVQVSNCRVHHNARNGIYLYSRDGASIHPTLANVEATDNGQNGLYLDASYGSALALTWDGGSISRNSWSGVTGATATSSIDLTLQNLAISANGKLGDNDARRRAIHFDAHNVHPVLENLTITDTQGGAIYWHCNGSITANHLTATGNGANDLQLPGCSVSSGRQWDLGTAGIPVRVTGDIAIAANAFLSLKPGTTLRFDKNVYGSLIGIRVHDQASLYALGTADKPIVFTGVSQIPGSWLGIEVAYDRSSLILNHCEVAYGGYYNANLYLHGHSAASPSPVQIQNCELHHSARKGMAFDWVWSQPPLVRNNSIHDNGEEGIANWNAPVIDARYNWWGDGSGPHHATQNPGGQGENVADNVLFYPWLSTPPSAERSGGTMLVTTGGPSQISPGETVDFAIQYLNGMTETVRNGVLMMQLPEAAYFVETSHGGKYWPDRHQVVWTLGDLLSGANNVVSVRVRFEWGLSLDYSDGSLTQFAGDNYNHTALDMAEYSSYQSTNLPVKSIQNLTSGEWSAILAANSNLNSLYQTAIGEGYQFLSAARITYDDDTVTVNAALRTADRKVGRILSASSGQVLATTVGSGVLAVRDMTGGLTASLDRKTIEFWGSWETSDSTQSASSGCNESRCFRNCMIKAKSWGKVARKVASGVSWVLPPLGAVWSTYEAYDEVATYLQCSEDCKADPESHCCTPGDSMWSATGLKGQCAKYDCDAVGTWKETPDIIKKCDPGQRCVAGKGNAGGCKECEASVTATFAPLTLHATDATTRCTTSGGSSCTNQTVRQAKDPNAIYGPVGDLLPGQTMAYTVTYENEGTGTAYGVYVVNLLPEVFDASTLKLYGKGIYLADSREIVWAVGTLGAKGAVDAQGSVTYTVALSGALPSGTVVSNRAVVFFPSVPEETPTNAWVNTIAPLVALPQQVGTHYGTPLAITLSGKDVSSLPLTFALAEQPHGGTLSGKAPNLTYTPAQHFSGEDAFTFQVSNGSATSRAAVVQITVSPAGDTTPPTILWSEPISQAKGVAFSDSPLFTDTFGAVYGPVIRIGFSEPLSQTGVNRETIRLSDGSQTLFTITVALETGQQEIVIMPRQPLAEGRNYTVTLSPEVTDAAGNSLAAPRVIEFSTAATEQSTYLPLIRR